MNLKASLVSASAESSVGCWSGFIASLCTQVRAALAVGLASEDEARAACDLDSFDESPPARRGVRSMDDYAGYMTSNGLGSLDVGGGGSCFDE